MERRVIKFNLVGAIFVLIIIIAIIVASIIYVPKLLAKKDENKDKNNVENVNNANVDNSIQGLEDGMNNKENIAESKNEEIDENKEYIETIAVNGEEQQVTMKICKGSFGYSMKYDVNGYYVEKNVDGADAFNSLYSNTVNVKVKLVQGNFLDAKQQASNTQNTNTSAEQGLTNILEGNVNGKSSFKTSVKNNDTYVINYFINNNDNSYYLIEINCGDEFDEFILPVMEKMVQSFEVLG